MKNKSKLVILIILVVIGIAVVSYASYAYIAASISGTNDYLNMTINVTRGVVVNFNAERGSNVTLNIDGAKMLQGDSGSTSIAGSLDGTIKVNAIADGNTTCTYNVNWLWENPENTSQYVKSIDDTTTKEFTISLTNGTSTISEQQLPNYSDEAKTLGAISTNLVENVQTTANLTYTVKFYNLALNQDIHIGKTYKGYLYIDTVSCR